MYREALPRIYELKEIVDNNSYPYGYFKDFEGTLTRLPEARRQFSALEKYLDILDIHAWASLKAKVTPYLSVKDADRGWHQLFDHLNEARAYQHIKELGAESISFIGENSTQRTPDIEAKLGSQCIFCEVKTINISECEAKRRRNYRVGNVEAALPTQFFNKLCKTLDSATDQLSTHSDNSNDRLIAYIVISRR
jgi:hypothetical protein